MAQIGRGNVTNVWQNLEDVIEGFSPTTDTEYVLQNIGAEDLQICEGTEAPTSERDGFVLTLNKTATLKKEDGVNFYVRAKYNSTVINLGTK